jgi:hypothetical protein
LTPSRTQPVSRVFRLIWLKCAYGDFSKHS